MIISTLLNYWLLYNYPSQLVVEGVHVSAVLIGHLINSWWHIYAFYFSITCLIITTILELENISNMESVQWHIFVIGIIAANLPFLHTLAFPILYYDAWLPMIMPFIYQNGHWIKTPYHILNIHPITRICIQILIILATTVVGMILEKLLQRPYNIDLKQAWWDDAGLQAKPPHTNPQDLDISIDSEDPEYNNQRFFTLGELTPREPCTQSKEQYADYLKKPQNNPFSSPTHVDSKGSSTSSIELKSTSNSPVGISTV